MIFATTGLALVHFQMSPAPAVQARPEIAAEVEKGVRAYNAQDAAFYETTLAADAELIAAYLDVLQVRMGKRLGWKIDVPAELAGYAMPPMLLQPIVENAIRHGLEPKVEGGEVHVTARREGAHVRIEVADTGLGFAPTTRGGLGLANLRERLRVLYGERAVLSIGENRTAGTVVTLALPA